MNQTPNHVWSGFAVSVRGPGHVERNLPCQDASAVQQTPENDENNPKMPKTGFGRPALIVCDGRGSSSRSQDGSTAAVSAFLSHLSIMEPFIASNLDGDDEITAAEQKWMSLCRYFYRALWQVQKDLACKHGIPSSEFDFTVAAAVVGTKWIGCFQVGDGSIVLQQDGTPVTVFLPDKGEYENQTYFLRERGEEKKDRFHSSVYPAEKNSGIAVTSDGPECLMFELSTMTPSPVFKFIFEKMQKGLISKEVITSYLSGPAWEKDPRGGDDRSIALLVPDAVKKAQGDSVSDTPKAQVAKPSSPVDEKASPGADNTEATGSAPPITWKKAMEQAKNEPSSGLPDISGSTSAPTLNKDKKTAEVTSGKNRKADDGKTAHTEKAKPETPAAAQTQPSPSPKKQKKKSVSGKKRKSAKKILIILFVLFLLAIVLSALICFLPHAG